MTQKSATTQIHLERARDLVNIMYRLDGMNLDVISIDYDKKRIEITRPAGERKVSEFPPLQGENRVTLMQMEGFIIFWSNPPKAQEMHYAKV